MRLLSKPSISWLVVLPVVFFMSFGANAQTAIDAMPVFDFSSSNQGQQAQSQNVSPVTPTAGEVSLDPNQNSPISQRTDIVGPTGLKTPGEDALVLYGSQLFSRANLVDRSIDVNSNYIISPGDRIAIKVWGARNFEDVRVVDLQGNIFLPEIGAIKVGGIPKGTLQNVVARHVATVFTNNVNVYTNLLGTQPISVFVTGGVVSPGIYPGSKRDSILYYLSRAGAISPNSGSYRSIRVIRDEQIIAHVDLYRFLLLGELLEVGFEDGDTIVVDPQMDTISVVGEVKKSYIFELDTKSDHGDVLLDIAQPTANASHAYIKGVRDGEIFADYKTLRQLKALSLEDGYIVELVRDHSERNLTIQVVGNGNGASTLVVPNTVRLSQVLSLIEVEPPEVADLNSIYLRRQSVAKRQKEAIQRSLYELQRSVMTSSSSTQREAGIRVAEAKLVEKFVANVMAVEPEGRVVLAGNRNWHDIALEDGDEIVIPSKSDVVVISGEVKMPLTILWKAGLTGQDYIRETGGVSNRGDTGNILVLMRNGSVHNGDIPIQRGDHIIVLPKDDVKNFAMFQDIIEMIYRVAVSSAVIINALK